MTRWDEIVSGHFDENHKPVIDSTYYQPHLDERDILIMKLGFIALGISFLLINVL